MPYIDTSKKRKNQSRQNTLFTILVFILSQISVVYAGEIKNTISLEALGKFEINYATAKTASSMQGQDLLGKVTFKAGNDFSVLLPFNIQKINFEVTNGSFVEQGDIVATVEGYDVHHFLDEFSAAKTLFEWSQKHYQLNKNYFQNKTISSTQWIEITKNYFDAKLNFEHFQHLLTFVQITDDHQVHLISPNSGLINIINSVQNKQGEPVFSVLETNNIEVKISMPLQPKLEISHFNTSQNCQLTINSKELIADKFHQTFWAKPAAKNCKLILGQTIKVTPYEKFTGYKIAKSAVFEVNNKNYLAIKANSQLSLVPIEIKGANNNEYFFSSAKDIANKQVLIRSTSILQGILLGLGAE